MGIFDGANDKSIPIGYNRSYFAEGMYRVEISALKALDGQKAFKGQSAFIAECICIASNNAMLPGAVASWYQGIDTRIARSAFAAIKEFLAAVLNDPKLESIPDLEAHLEIACSEANPYRGLQLDLVTTVKPPKPPKTDPFTVHSWKPLGYLHVVGDRVKGLAA